MPPRDIGRNKMIPRFTTPETVDKGWGKEQWLCNNEEYCGKLLEFNAGSKFSMHYHLNKREHFYVLKGFLILTFFNLQNADKKSHNLLEGQVVEIPRGVPHQIEAKENSVIIEISTHHEDSDSYRIAKGDSQKVI
jgi:mannose-6-phosphate isomerase-like protein (cupin superfamily)